MVKKPHYWKELFNKCEIKPIEPNDEMSFKVKYDKNRFYRMQTFQIIKKLLKNFLKKLKSNML